MVLKKYLVVIMSRYNKDILDKDILVHQMKDRIKEHTWNYHNKLMKLLEAKTHGDGEGGKNTDKLFRDVCEDFGSVVATQRNMIEVSLDLVKLQLERAFVLSGLEVNEGLTDLEKRVYSGETIVGDKKKMYWDEKSNGE